MKSERKESKITSGLPVVLNKSCLFYVDVATLCESTLVSKNGIFFESCKYEAFWQALYTCQFGKPKYKYDYKAQCCAEFLLAKANTDRADQAYFYFSKLREFLIPLHQNKPWAQYYLGRVDWSNPSSTDVAQNGIDCLMWGVVDGDVRAAQFLVYAMYSAGNDSDDMELILGRIYAKDVFTCLKRAVDEGNHKAKRELGYMHAMGIGTCCDSEPAFDLFKDSLTLDMKTSRSLSISETDLHSLYNAIDFDLLENPNQGMDFLYELFYKTYHPSIACVIGLICNENHDVASAKFWFMVAHMYGNGLAAYTLANNVLYEAVPPDSVDDAQRLLLIASSRGMTAADTQHACLLLEREEKDINSCSKAIELLKKSFFAGDTDAASILSAKFREEKGWEDDARKVWWVQTAALCGNGFSRKALISAAKCSVTSSSRFALCTMVFLMELGVPGQDFMTPNHQLAMRSIKAISLEDINQFLAAGEKEGLLTRCLERICIRLYGQANPHSEVRPAMR